MHSHALAHREKQRQQILIEADDERRIQQDLPASSFRVRSLVQRLSSARWIGLTAIMSLRLPRRLAIQG